MRPEFPENHGSPPSAAFTGPPPSWSSVRDLLARRGLTLKIRMIDGLPAFPDEEPREDWKELRVAAAGGMVTIRREANRVTFVTWGNAGRGVLQAANAFAWAFAEAGSGTIDGRDAAAFLRAADVPDALKSDSAL